MSESPSKIAVISDEYRLTWSELGDSVRALTSIILAQNLPPKVPVSILSGHGLSQVISIFALASCDIPFHIFSPSSTEIQVAHQLQQLSPSAILISPQFESRFKDMKLETTVISTDITARQTLGEQPTPPSRSTIPSDVATFFFTSGSTGKPKAVVTPHRTLLDGARIVSTYLGIDTEDRILSFLPFSFDYGLNQLMSVVHVGCELVLHQYRLPIDLYQAIERFQPTGIAGVPSMWNQFVSAIGTAGLSKDSLRSVRYLTTAGGFHSQRLLQDLDQTFPQSKIIVMYGLTESFRSTFLPYEELFRRPGSIGRAVPEVEILVIDENGRECDRGEIGELVHRGAFISYGYLNDPEMTQKRFMNLDTGGQGCRKEVAVKSGDLGSMDEDGYVYFHGRIDSQLKLQGYRVSPTEIEDGLIRTGLVEACAVVGLEDEPLIFKAGALCVPMRGIQWDTRNVLREARKYLPSPLLPTIISTCSELPVTTTGKIDYVEAKKLLEESRERSELD